MNSNQTQIVVVLDRSGSMESIRSATISGFNEFLESQKRLPGEARIMLTQFDNVYEVVYERELKDAPLLTSETFVPRGSTALLDAIGRTINDAGAKLSALAEDQRPGKVVFVIMTDGMENASQEFDRRKVFEMIAHQRDTYQWEFVFLGANQDAIAQAGMLGINQNSSITYAAAPQQVRATMAAASSYVAQARGGLRASFTAAQRVAAMGPDPKKRRP